MPEAAVCIIQHKEGGYLRRSKDNKFVRASALAEATRFTPEKAQSVLKNSIKAAERARWEIVSAPDPAKPASEITAFVPGPQIKPPQQQKAPSNAAAKAVPIRIQGQLPDSPVDLTAFVQEQAKLYGQIRDYLAVLPQELSKVDAEINDLLHYIEMTNLNAAEGYRTYARLKECRLRRRVLKNDMSKFAVLSSATMDDLLSGKLTEAMQAIDNDQAYKPRQLPELFTELA